MTQITEDKNCTACGACSLLCPLGCIEMVGDKEGFFVARINEKCTDCGLCAARCPANNSAAFLRDTHVKVIGARLKNDMLLKKSASGGVFAGIAAEILKTQGNAVFGCAFDEKIVAWHVCVTDFKNIGPCQSSKYVQSDVGDTYLQAKEFLDDGKTVFYTGCPCQIAGLYAFLGADYKNLLTADLICHGVPLPLLFKKYLDWLGKKLGGEITGYNFRSKMNSGWGLEAQTATKTKTEFIFPWADPYYNAFIKNNTLRECCYICPYAGERRVADITLGDFWGVELFHSEFYDSRGVSVVIVNTAKGEDFLKKNFVDFHILQSSFENAAAQNHCLQKPSPRPPLRDFAYRDINSETAEIFKGKAYKPDKKAVIKSYIKRVTPLFVVRAYKALKRRIKKS